MVHMLRHDIVYHPTEHQLSLLSLKKTNVSAQAAVNANKRILEESPLEKISDKEMDAARSLLNEEIEIVKKAMAHGDLSIDVYTRVWEECYGQVRRKIYLMFFPIPI